MSIDMAQFHQVFFEESFEGLDIMESGLLNMDPGTVDPEDINTVFRAAHSIKGGSGTFGFEDIASFTHVMETLLDEMRDGRRSVNTETVDVLLQSVDTLRELLSAARDGGEADEARVNAQKAALERVLNDAPESPADDTEDINGTAAQPIPREEPRTIGWHIVFRPHPHMMQTGNDPLRIIRELASLGESTIEADTHGLPSFQVYEPEQSYLSWDIRLRGEIPRTAVDEIFEWVEDDCDLAVMPILDELLDAHVQQESVNPSEQIRSQPVAESAKNDDSTAKGESPVGSGTNKATGKRKSAAGGSTGSIRVDIGKIDALINMVGELVITQSMLGMLGEDFDMSRVDRLQDGLAQLERHTRELQESVMQIRMLPISFTFSRFPRLVHDLSTKLGKKVELKLTGEHTEVDKTVIEKIGDPLVHLVRNSLDHGLETPEERIAAGKQETGSVELNAFHRGGNIIIEVRDDGRGLDKDRLLKKGIEKGLVAENNGLSDKQIYDLIFAPGFSTAEKVSDVSGRGVGMDVVRKNIMELGGSIEIDSEPGKGSAIIIRLPLTLAILDGQTVAVGDETYIVPLTSIIESIQIRPDMVNLVAGRGETFKLRDEYLPIVRLHDVLKVENARAKELTEGLLVVVEGEGRRCGLFVDDLRGQQQVVIKSLEANYGKVMGISGATILGDGSVALILDIPGLMRQAFDGDPLTSPDWRLSA